MVLYQTTLLRYLSQMLPLPAHAVSESPWMIASEVDVRAKLSLRAARCVTDGKIHFSELIVHDGVFPCGGQA
jgi:hypothetical protein